MNGPLHVLVANVFFAPYSYGGATLVAEAVARELARLGHRISAVSAMARRDLPAYSVVRTTPFPGVDNYLVALPPGRGAAEIDENPAVTDRLAPLVRRLGPDLAHVHCVQELGAGLVPLFKAESVPTVLSFHDFWWVCARQFMLRPDGRYCGQDPIEPQVCAACAGSGAPARLARLTGIARQADLRTAPSRFAAGLIERSGTGPVAVWQNGIAPPGARREPPPRPVTFGYLGGPSPAKGWPQLRAALGNIGRDDFALLLVDGGSDTRPWWRPAMLGGLGGAPRILPRFAADRADGFYDAIDVLLFPSQWKESFGLAVREALARGVRVIRTGGGGQAEHPATPAVRELAIGAPPEALAALMGEAIDEITAGAPRRLPPLSSRSQAEQARDLLALVGGFLPASAARARGQAP